MIYKEYALYDLDYSEIDIKTSIESMLNFGIDNISVPYFYTKLAKGIVTNYPTITISNAIDYPFGLSDIKTRNEAVSNAIDNGATKISLVLQNNYLSNKKYDKIRQDISSNLEICKKHNVDLIYYLEYRVFTHQSLIKACNLLLEANLDKVYVSTGHMLDEIHDNIIAVNLLKQKTNINPIFTANIWTKDHVALLKKNDISCIRFNNLNAVRTYCSHKDK